MTALRVRYPNVVLYLHEDKTTRLLECLRTHQLDAAIIALPWKANGIAAVAAFDDEFLVAAPARHRLAEKGNLTPDDLVDEDMLLLEDGHCLRAHALSVCSRSGGFRSAQVAATSLTTLVNMVASGLGVSLLPRLAIENGLQVGGAVAVRPFARPVVGRSVGVAWRAGSSREAAARAIAEMLKETCGADARGRRRPCMA